LHDLVSLSSLNLNYNQVTDISTLSDHKRLSKLELSHNRITDLNPLSDHSSLWEIDVRNNPLDEQSIKFIHAAQSRGGGVITYGNEITIKINDGYLHFDKDEKPIQQSGNVSDAAYFYSTRG
jgi:Leucine-rich repeat (LRR) protein